MKTRPPLIMDQVLTLHKLGRSSLEIAVELNLTRPVVYTAMRRLEKKGLVAKRDGTDAEKSYSLLLEYRDEQERRAVKAASRKLLHRLEQIYGPR